MSFVNQNGTTAVVTTTNRNPARKHNKHEDEEAGKVFVGGLSWETTQENLLRYFSRFGEVIDCVVMKNAESGRSRGFGFVTFSDPGNIDSVIQSCPHTLDGRTIDPKPCNPRSMQKPKKNTTWPKVFLGGLPSSITETDLRGFFSRYGEVMEVVIMYDQEKKKARGFGFLSFTNEDAVDRAVVEHYVNIQNKQVEIKRAEPRTNMAELSNGPVVDQWGAPAPQPPTNGIHNGPATPTIYSGWGAPPISASVAPPPAQTFSQQPAFPSHWGSPPSTQPNITSWGAPPPPSSYPAAAAAPQQIQYSNHHFISPQPNPTPPTFTNPTPPHTFTTSYWGSPPGPTPPPSTPQEMYSPHAPQSPPQPKYEMSAVPAPAFHLHPAPAPPEYARIYPKVQVSPAPQFTSTGTPEFYSPPVVAPAVQYTTEPRIGGIGTAYGPPQIGTYHPYRRT